MTPQLFRKNHAELLACSFEGDEVFVKLVAGARETEQMPFLLAETDCMLEHGAHRRHSCQIFVACCSVPREIELPVVVPGTCKSEIDGEFVFIIEHHTPGWHR